MTHHFDLWLMYHMDESDGECTLEENCLFHEPENRGERWTRFPDLLDGAPFPKGPTISPKCYHPRDQAYTTWIRGMYSASKHSHSFPEIQLPLPQLAGAWLLSVRIRSSSLRTEVHLHSVWFFRENHSLCALLWHVRDVILLFILWISTVIPLIC